MPQVVGIGRFVEKTKVSGEGDFLWGGFVIKINKMLPIRKNLHTFQMISTAETPAISCIDTEPSNKKKKHAADPKIASSTEPFCC